MFSASDLIDVVSDRARVRWMLRAGAATPPGEFPPAWKAWFARMGDQLGTITGATAAAIVAVFLQREMAVPPRRMTELNRWQAFATLWRQQWSPAETEDRGVRWFAAALTLAIHLLLLGILLWLASVRFLVTSRPQGEDVVQVEYVGEGTPEEGAGGAPKAVTSQPPKPAAASAQKPQPARPVKPSAAAKVAATPVPTSVPTPPIATPAPVPAPAPAPEQPLQVSQVPIPDSTFALPPPTPRALEMPKVPIAEPALQVPIRDIELAKEPSPPAPPQPKPVTPAPAPVVRAPAVPVPVVPAPATPAVATRPAAPTLPQPPTPSPPLEQPLPAAPPATSPTTAPSPPRQVATTPAAAPATAPPTTQPLAGGAPAAASGSQPARPMAGNGVTTAAKPGARPALLRNDDWGASDRNRPGGDTGKQPGLFNADGSPRLSTTQPGGGFPPGSDKWTKDQFDRAGVWLKRKPNDFTPTRFDKVWVPSETLLEEWVRRNVRAVSIPIPGTSKSLDCKISLLQLGGGCTISDPNMNDQEAEARPPPDIPFKPELQEDQQSLRKPGSP